MSIKFLKNGFLSNNTLKIIALICMTLDHTGKTLFPQIAFLQIAGRLAFPIFSFMIAEGCHFTKNRRRYFLILFSLGIIFQFFYFLAEKSLYMGIFITFSLSILLIYAFDNLKKRKTIFSFLIFWGIFILIYLLCQTVPKTLKGFDIDYGFWGVMLPFWEYLTDKKYLKLLLFTLGLIILSLTLKGIQYYCLLSVVFLMFYNNKRGKLNLKYLFYIYYPLHLVIIYLIALL